MGPREECSLHPSVRLHPHFNLKAARSTVDVKEVAEREAHTSSILRLQPDRVQCMVCHKCGLCCAARKHEVGQVYQHTYFTPINVMMQSAPQTIYPDIAGRTVANAERDPAV